MLTQLINAPLLLVFAQSAPAIALALAVLWVARQRSVHLERETILALARGLLQVSAAGAGASPAASISRQVEAAVAASLIPRIDNLRSLGIVWLPGLMTGMILAGADPLYSAVYQFVVIAIIYAGSGLTALSGVLLLRNRTFTRAEQLALKREHP
jgi:ABC-type iron transport system FetAB permease component